MFWLINSISFLIKEAIMITKALLLAYIAWIGSHTSYDVSVISAPRVELHSQEGLNHIYYKGMACRSGKPPNIEAVYVRDAGGTAHFNKKIDSKNPEDQSVLIHEMLHHVQYFNEARAPKTARDREAEAVVVENKWRVEHGLRKLNRTVLPDFCNAS